MPRLCSVDGHYHPMSCDLTRRASYPRRPKGSGCHRRRAGHLEDGWPAAQRSADLRCHQMTHPPVEFLAKRCHSSAVYLNYAAYLNYAVHRSRRIGPIRQQTAGRRSYSPPRSQPSVAFRMTVRRNHRCGHRRKDWRCVRGIRRRLSQHDPRLGAWTNHRAAAQIQNRTENPLPSQHLSRRTIKTRAVRRRTALVRKCVRRRPTLPRSGPRSTIGAERLSFRVRDGTGRFPLAMVAETLWRCGPHYPHSWLGIASRDRTSGTAQWTRSKS